MTVNLARLSFVVALAACSAPPHARIDSGRAPDDASDAAALVPADAPIDGPARPDPFVALAQLPGLCTPDGWCWQEPTPTGNRWFSVYGPRADNIWLLGAKGTIAQWNGQTWRWHHPPPLPGQESVQWPVAMAGTDPDDMWLILMSAVEHWDGATWTIVDAGPTSVFPYFRSIWRSPGGDVYTVSSGGLRRSRGGNPFETIYADSKLGSVWGTADDDIFLTGTGQIVHFDGNATFTQAYSDGTSYIFGLMGFPDDVWATGGPTGLFHYDGHAWTTVATGLADTGLGAVGMRASNDAWWVTSSGSFGQSFVHWNGTSFEQTPIDPASYGDRCCPQWHGVSIIDDRWWILSDTGEIWTRIGGGALRPVLGAPPRGSQMWGAADDDMYFSVGTTLSHWDGAQWSTMGEPEAFAITGVAGAGIGGADELFSIGSRNDGMVGIDTAQRFDGQVWTTTELSSHSVIFAPELTAVWAIGPGEAFVVGNHGLAFRHHDGAWTPVATRTTADLRGVWGPDADHLWITGTGGTLLRWDRASPDALSPDPTFPPTTKEMGGITGADGTMWIAHPNTYSLSMHDAGGWHEVTSPLVVTKVFASSNRDVVVTSQSNNGRLAHWNGEAFVVEDFGYEMLMLYAAKPRGGTHWWLTDGQRIMVHP